MRIRRKSETRRRMSMRSTWVRDAVVGRNQRDQPIRGEQVMDNDLWCWYWASYEETEMDGRKTASVAAYQMLVPFETQMQTIRDHIVSIRYRGAELLASDARLRVTAILPYPDTHYELRLEQIR